MKKLTSFACFVTIAGVVSAFTAPAAAAKTFWEQLQETAPRSVHCDFRYTTSTPRIDVVDE